MKYFFVSMVLLAVYGFALFSLSKQINSQLPFFVKIDSVENADPCIDIRPAGHVIEVHAKCYSPVYVRDEDGAFRKEAIFLTDDEEARRRHLPQLQSEAFVPVKTYTFEETRFDPFHDCKSHTTRIVDDVDICNRAELKKAGKGTPVSYWVLRLRADASLRDTVVRGGTLYQPSRDDIWLLSRFTAYSLLGISLSALISGVVSFVLLITRKRNYSLWIPGLFLALSFCTFFLVGIFNFIG